MKVLGSWTRSHPFQALALFLALMVLGVTLGNVTGGFGGFLVQFGFQVSSIMLGIVFVWAGRR
jgi:hypothetical protein